MKAEKQQEILQFRVAPENLSQSFYLHFFALRDKPFVKLLYIQHAQKFRWPDTKR